ncbi:unnamed protein product [marine sediment metagenome]|uniref:Uncharacterized protein n=1 Tax=marine sediment metagenome TaxID=412755 RepID=X1H5B9_9ZZZZ
MGVEGDYAAKQIFLPGSLVQSFNQVAMPCMNAVKDADGDKCFLFGNYAD